MPITSQLLHPGQWQLDDDTVSELASRLRAEFAQQISSWSDVVRAAARLLDEHISLATLADAEALAEYLGHQEAAIWLDALMRHPETVKRTLDAQLEHHARFMDLGPYVRRSSSTHDGVEQGPGPWHLAECVFVARAGDVTRWEGVDVLPEEGRSCRTCRPRKEVYPSELPPAEADRARDAVRDEIAALGAFVRRRGEEGEVPIPPGKWHLAGCRTTRTAADPRLWEGSRELPVGEDMCKTCLRNPPPSPGP